MIVIDEVHFIRQSGRSFRQEFQTMLQFLAHLLKLMPRPCPRLLLSATVLEEDVNECTAVFGNMCPNILVSGPPEYWFLSAGQWRRSFFSKDLR